MAGEASSACTGRTPAYGACGGPGLAWAPGGAPVPGGGGGCSVGGSGPWAPRLRFRGSARISGTPTPPPLRLTPRPHPRGRPLRCGERVPAGGGSRAVEPPLREALRAPSIPCRDQSIIPQQTFHPSAHPSIPLRTCHPLPQTLHPYPRILHPPAHLPSPRPPRASLRAPSASARPPSLRVLLQPPLPLHRPAHSSVPPRIPRSPPRIPRSPPRTLRLPPRRQRRSCAGMAERPRFLCGVVEGRSLRGRGWGRCPTRPGISGVVPIHPK